MTSVRRGWLVELACVTGLLLLAAALRLYRLQDYPAGYHNDESAVAHLVETVMAGRLSVFFPEETGTEPLYMILSAPFGLAAGPTVFVLRLPSVFLTMIALCAVWVLTRRLLGARVAMVALAAMSVSWWSMLVGRITSHVVTVAPTLALAVYFFWRGRLRRAAPAAIDSALAGVFFALSFYAYTAARMMPILVLALAAFTTFVQRDAARRSWPKLLLMIGVAALLSAPLALHLVTHPEAKQLNYSLFDVDQPLSDLLSGKPQLAMETTLRTLGMFVFAGDPLPYYNIPGRPLLGPLSAILFLIGLAALVWRWREPRYGVVLIGLFVTLSPGMLSQPAPNYARTVGAMAFAFAVLGIGVDIVWQRAIARWGSRARLAGTTALAALLLGHVAWTVRDFFVVWPALPETRWWMQTGLKEAAEALESGEGRGPAAICVSSRLIDEGAEWWRPAWWTYHYLSPRTESDVRWYDCSEAVVIPKGTRGTLPRFVFPDVSSAARLDGLPVSRWMRPADGQTVVGQSLIVQADPARVWAAQVARLAADRAVAWPPEAEGERPATLPVDLGHALQLTAYDVQGRAAPGTAITVTTYWQVIAPLEPRLALFSHVLTGTSIVAQADHLAITSHSLQPGDVFMQIHMITLPDGVERGWYDLAVGVYSRDTGERLPAYDGASPVSDRILLQPLRVWRQP